MPILPLLFVAFTTVASAQMDTGIKLILLSPAERQVFQRDTRSDGKIVVETVLEMTTRGALTNLDRLEARVIGPSTNDNNATAWQTLPFDNRVRHFRAELRAPAGGWCRVQVRLLAGGKSVSEANVEHVGVGEVFVIAGQSNSANHGEEKQSAKNPFVVAFGNGHWQVAADPEPGASGNGGSFMPAFGDAMAGKFKVPIGIASCRERVLRLV